MTLRSMLFSLLCCAALTVPATASADMLVELPAPQKTGGLSVREALAARHVERSFDSRPLPVQEVSNILWAACGVNRDDGRLTVPTAMNYQRIGVYAVLSDGVYRYDARNNALEQVLQGENWLNELREYLFQNRNAAAEYLQKHLPEVSLIHAEATYLLWIDCRNVTENIENLEQHIRKKTGLYLCAGTEYGKAGEGFLRMNIACSKQTMMDGLHRLKKGIDSYNDSSRQI